MARFFNVSGPCEPAKHYMLPAEERLPDVRRLIDMERYFVVHAPRQTGKTATISAPSGWPTPSFSSSASPTRMPRPS